MDKTFIGVVIGILEQFRPSNILWNSLEINSVSMVLSCYVTPIEKCKNFTKSSKSFFFTFQAFTYLCSKMYKVGYDHDVHIPFCKWNIQWQMLSIDVQDKSQRSVWHPC